MSVPLFEQLRGQASVEATVRIGIDARMAHKEGLGRYVREITPRVADADATNEIVVYVKSREAGAELESHARRGNLRAVVVPGVTFLPREQLALAHAIGRDRLDLLHVTFDHGLPLRRPRRLVLTVHDAFVGSPIYFRSRWTRLYYETQTRRGILCADRVLTVSEFVRERIVKAYPERADLAERVCVAPNAIGPEFSLADGTPTPPASLRTRGIDRYLLYVGVLIPHKNVGGLVAAYAQLRQRVPDAPPLVVAGRPHPLIGDPTELARRAGVTEHVHFIGFVPDAELPDLYRAATLFAFPSFHEGFGIPALESMACGTPVLASNAGALPEVVGDAALQVDPHSVDAIATALARLLEDAALRSELRTRGLARVRQFSWERTAGIVLAQYRECHAAA